MVDRDAFARGLIRAGLAVLVSTAAMAAQPYRGEVTKVDAAGGKVTLKHGPIAKLDMGAMTMGYRAADPAMLKNLKAGDHVTFDVTGSAENPMLTRIEKAAGR